MGVRVMLCGGLAEEAVAAAIRPVRVSVSWIVLMIVFVLDGLLRTTRVSAPADLSKIIAPETRSGL
jgi:hypothetical protein